MINITAHRSSVRKIMPGDSKFNIIDGITVMPRAGIEIDRGCPQNYKHIIEQCAMRGWIRPIAYVKDNELFWEELGN